MCLIALSQLHFNCYKSNSAKICLIMRFANSLCLQLNVSAKIEKNTFYTYITERINYKPISNPIPAEALNHALSDPIYDKILDKNSIH